METWVCEFVAAESGAILQPMATNDYQFITHWRVEASAGDLYNVLVNAEGYSRSLAPLPLSELTDPGEVERLRSPSDFADLAPRGGQYLLRVSKRPRHRRHR